MPQGRTPHVTARERSETAHQHHGRVFLRQIEPDAWAQHWRTRSSARRRCSSREISIGLRLSWSAVENLPVRPFRVGRVWSPVNRQPFAVAVGAMIRV